MKISLLLTLLLVGYTSYCFAQSSGTISGQIHNPDEKLIDYSGATISLLRANDSTVVQFTMADKRGMFIFENVAYGKYFVTATLVGFNKGYSSSSEITSEKIHIELPTIPLIPTTKGLTGITVTTRKPLIEQKIDRTIVNVEASVTNTGSTALEVLEKAPGVTVDKDGNISLKGKEGVLIMIDGRPTPLGGADLANLLRTLSSSQLDQIEIMTNPPARYEAAGNAGVINIKTKKNKTAGYNASLNIGFTQGRYPRTSEGFSFNYREGKVNLFTNVSHDYRKSFNKLTIQRNLRNNDTKDLENYFEQEANMINEGASYNAKAGLDYFPNKKTTVGITLSGFLHPTKFSNRNKTEISSPSKELESTTRAIVSTRSQWKNFSANLNFRRLLDSSGKELTSDVDFITYQSENKQVMVNSYFNRHGNSLQKSDTLHGALPQNINIYSARMDYLQPLKKGAKFEAGIKSSLVQTDNDAGYDSIQYGTKVHDFYRSNHFLYEENINAVYATVSKPLTKKLNTQLGLRLENTNATGRQLTTGQHFDRHYTQLFPTFYLQYKNNEKNNFGFNYGRRLRRPNYESLNPFIRFLDRYTYTQGNPDLKPQFSHNLELTHTYRNFFTTTINYTATNDIIQNVIEQKGQEAYAKRANIASLRQFGIAFNANHSVTKWWTNSIYVNIYRNHFEGVVNQAPISFHATSLSLNGSQQFKLSKLLTAELSGFYRSAGLEGVVKLRGRGMLAAGISQQIKDKGSIRITIRDIFYTQQARATIRYGNVDAAFQERGDSRVVSIGFSYRFSKGKINTQRKRLGDSAGEEKNRVGVE